MLQRSIGTDLALRCVITIMASLLILACGASDSTDPATVMEATVDDTGSDVTASTAVVPTPIADQEAVAEALDELSAIEASPPPPDSSGPRYRAGIPLNDETLSEFLTIVFEDVNQFWTNAFASAELSYEKPETFWLADQSQDYSRMHPECVESIEGTSTGAFYCAANPPLRDAIVSGLDVIKDQFQEVFNENEFGSKVDFATAMMVAHEMGHHVQHQIDLIHPVPRYPSFGLRSPQIENHADCLAGVWAHSAFEQGRLEEGDVQEAMRIQYAVGDWRSPDEASHGKPQERVAFFLYGYKIGSSPACDVALYGPSDEEPSSGPSPGPTADTTAAAELPVIDLVFAKDVSADGQPVEPTSTFDWDDPRLVQFIYWEPGALSAGTTILIEWYEEVGRKVYEETISVEEGIGGWYIPVDLVGHSHNMRFEVVASVDGVILGLGAFVLEGEPPPAAQGATAPAAQSIGVLFAKGVSEDGQPLEFVSPDFESSDPQIVQFIRWNEGNIPAGSVIRTEWHAEDDQLYVSGEYVVEEGVAEMYFTVEPGSSGFPVGMTQVRIFVDGAEAMLATLTIQ